MVGRAYPDYTIVALMTPTHYVILMLTTVAIQYAVAAGAYQFSGRPGMAIAFVGYLIANIGLILDALQK